MMFVSSFSHNQPVYIFVYSRRPANSFSFTTNLLSLSSIDGCFACGSESV